MLERDHYRLESGATVPFVVRRHPRARRLRLKVAPPGRIELLLPSQCTLRQAGDFLHRHGAWLESQLTPMLQALAQRPSELHLAALGEQWQLTFAPATQRSGVRQSHHSLLISHHPDDWQTPLLRWLARRAEAHLSARLNQLSEEIGIDYARLVIRGQRSRWGSCSGRGTISLNYKALLLPPEQVEYLLIHELCHRVHMNHSAAFWALVASHLPDHAERRRELRKRERELPLWLGMS